MATPCVGLGAIYPIYAAGGANGLLPCGGVFVLIVNVFHTITTVENLRSGSFSFLPEPMIGVKL